MRLESNFPWYSNHTCTLRAHSFCCIACNDDKSRILHLILAYSGFLELEKEFYGFIWMAITLLPEVFLNLVNLVAYKGLAWRKHFHETCWGSLEFCCQPKCYQSWYSGQITAGRAICCWSSKNDSWVISFLKCREFFAKRKLGDYLKFTLWLD